MKENFKRRNFKRSFVLTHNPVGKIAEKAVCRSVFINSVVKNTLLQTAFLVILPTESTQKASCYDESNIPVCVPYNINVFESFNS